MESYQTAINKVYKKVNDCIIIGLTGRTGSGCTTTSKILGYAKFKDLNLPKPKERNFEDTEDRKYSIIYNYMKNNWEPFITIEASSIILSFVFEYKFEEFISYLESLCKGTETNNFRIPGFSELKIKLEGIRDWFSNDSFEKIKDTASQESSIKELDYFISTLNKQKNSFSDLLSEYSCYESKKSKFKKSEEKKSQLYTFLMQSFGNNIRSSGNPFNSKFDEIHFICIAERIGKLIDYALNNCKYSRICIDAIRNPYEAYYFKDKYKQFYLVSVTTNDEDRRSRLKRFNEDQLHSLDDMEYPVDFKDGKIFFQQSIAECLQISDIHLYNPNSAIANKEDLTRNLVRYIGLMLHPGLVSPTHIERCMQMAFNAKLNSGCLSRQVGSVITDNDYYIKAIGWNDVPQGQVSCNLRTLQNYFTENDHDTYSIFELENNSFRANLQYIADYYSEWQVDNKTNLYNIPMCFKDIYNGMNKDKNQVYTRSLHAEENAFLQISKFGGRGIENGKLFVTASPCELCSKKSYQLGIRDIYYIDPYPGIASTHILKGSSKNNPNLHLFYGAVGNAYVSLYTQRFATKDELQLVTGIDVKDRIKNKNNTDNSLNYKTIEYKEYEIELHFTTRHEISFKQKATLIPLNDDITEIPKTISWTGGTYVKTEALEGEYDIEETDIGNGRIKLLIKPNSKITKEDEFTYEVLTKVTDENETMNTNLSYHVIAKTEKLSMRVSFDKSFFNEEDIKDIYFKRYADMEENIVFDEENPNFEDDENEFCLIWETQKPLLLYAYSIEWKFNEN